MPNPPLRRDPGLVPLSHQHQHGLAICVLIERGLKAEPTPEKADALAGKVKRLAEVELLGHFGVEEAVLFPAVRQYLGSGELLDALVAEHRVMEDLVRRIAVAGAPQRTVLLLRFAEVLRAHIRAEERELFPQIQDRLDEARLAVLGRAIEARIRATCPLGDRLPWKDA